MNLAEKPSLPGIASGKDISHKKRENDYSREKIMLVENIPIEIFEKVEILLVMAGAKSAADIRLDSDAWEEGENPKHVVHDRLEEITRNLKELRLAFYAKNPFIDKIPLVEDDSIPKDQLKPEDIINNARERIVIEVAGNDQLLEEAIKAAKEGDHEKMGELYGFPKTAISEFLKEDRGEESDLISRVDLPEEIRKEDWSMFAYYQFSRENWEMELEIAKKWAGIVKRMSPKIYGEYVEYMREVKNF
jgi:hypothetical protein